LLNAYNIWLYIAQKFQILFVSLCDSMIASVDYNSPMDVALKAALEKWKWY
jgi:hypothetical protein